MPLTCSFKKHVSLALPIFLASFLLIALSPATAQAVTINVYCPTESFQSQQINIILRLENQEADIENLALKLMLPFEGEVFQYQGPTDHPYSYDAEKGEVILSLSHVDGEQYAVFRNIYVMRNSESIGQNYSISIYATYIQGNQEQKEAFNNTITILRGPPSARSPGLILLLVLPMIGLFFGGIIFFWLYKFVPESKF